MLKVYLLRHGETNFNADGNRYCGRTDAELTERGMQQAALVCDQLEKFDFEGIYSSPLQRAHLTASIASADRPVIKDERLIELDFGKWEGKTKEEFVAEDPLLLEKLDGKPRFVQSGGHWRNRSGSS